MVATEQAMGVKLTPGFPLELGKKLWSWLNSPREPNFDDFGPATQEDFLLELAHRIRREGTWGIWSDGELVGYLGYYRTSPMAVQFHGLVIKPENRGRGYGTAAFRSAIQELRDRGVSSFTVMPYRGNTAIERVLRRVGFNFIGMLNGATRRDRQPLDVSMWHKGED